MQNKFIVDTGHEWIEVRATDELDAIEKAVAQVDYEVSDHIYAEADE